MTNEEDLKKRRTALKAAITRKETKLRRLLAEKDKDNVIKQMELLKEDMCDLDEVNAALIVEADTDDKIKECDDFM